MGIGEIIEIGSQILEYDKNDVIKGIVYRRFSDLRRKKLGPKPSEEDKESFLQELERLLED